MKELWKNFVYDIKKSPFRWFFIISLFFMVAFCILFNHGDSHLFHMWSINIWDAIFHGHIHDYFEYTAKFEWMGNPYSVLIYVPQAIWNFPIWLLHEIDNSINLAQPGFWAWSKMFYVLCTYVTAVYLRKTLNFFNIDKYWRDLAVVLCFGAISMMVSIGEAGQDEMLYIMLFTMGGYCLLRDKIKTAL